jgi:hypothetical protein
VRAETFRNEIVIISVALTERLEFFNRQNPDIDPAEWDSGVDRIVKEFMEENGYYER